MFLNSLFTTSGSMPHGQSLSWPPEWMWTIVLSDSLIGLACIVIAITWYWLARNMKLPLRFAFFAFAGFVLASGLTHFADVYTLWVPNFWLAAVVKVIAALASLFAAVYLISLFSQLKELGEAARHLDHSREHAEYFFFKKLTTPPAIKRLLVNAIVLPLLVGMALIATAVFSVRYQESTQSWIAHSDDVIKRANNLQSYASATEDDFTGFWLADHKQLVDAAHESAARFKDTYANLLTRVADDPAQTQQLYKINSLFEEWLRYIQSERNHMGQRFERAKQISNVLILVIVSLSLILGALLVTIGRRTLLSVSESFGRTLESEKLAHDNLKKAMAQLRQIANAAPVIMVQLDARERLLFANDAFCNWYDLNPDEVIGMSFQRIVGEEVYQAHAPWFKRALAGEQVVYERETTGNRREATFNVTLVPNIEGRNPGFVLIASDITKFKESKENERIYRAIGESIDYGIWICAPDGRNTYTSESLLKLIGLTQEECSNFGWSGVLHPEDSARTAAAWKECVRTGGVWDIQQRFLGVDGKWHPVLARGVPIRNDKGEISRWAGINLDISALQESQAALEQARDVALRANRVKDSFLAVLSHELRTPLTTILGWAQQLLSRKEIPPSMMHALSVIERSAHVQGQLIEDLLDISRIQAGKLSVDLQAIDVTETAKLAIQAAQTLAGKKAISIEAELGDLPCYILADPVRMEQVFWNLLNNAVKFTPENGKIFLRLEVVESTAGKSVKVEVADNGCGIKADFLPHIFERFSQEDTSMKRRHGGLGLGLSLVKSLVELQQGTVSAVSPGEGQGTVFTVCLPLISPAHALLPNGNRGGAGQLNPVPLDGIRILVVDDDMDSLDLFEDMLTSCGATVRLASSAEIGHRLFLQMQPDILLSDISMPGEDGYSFIRKIRALSAHTPAIALTAYAGSDEIKRILEAGFTAHLAKPVHKNKLLQAIVKAGEK